MMAGRAPPRAHTQTMAWEQGVQECWGQAACQTWEPRPVKKHSALRGPRPGQGAQALDGVERDSQKTGSCHHIPPAPS